MIAKADLKSEPAHLPNNKVCDASPCLSCVSQCAQPVILLRLPRQHQWPISMLRGRGRGRGRHQWSATQCSLKANGAMHESCLNCSQTIAYDIIVIKVHQDNKSGFILYNQRDSRSGTLHQWRHQDSFSPWALAQINNLYTNTNENNVDRKKNHMKVQMLAVLVTCTGVTFSQSGRWWCCKISLASGASQPGLLPSPDPCTSSSSPLCCTASSRPPPAPASSSAPTCHEVRVCILFEWLLQVSLQYLNPKYYVYTHFST